MVDYWNKLKLDEAWSKKQKFNIMMDYLMSQANGATGEGQELVVEEDEEVGTIHVTVTSNQTNEPIENVIVHVYNDNNSYEGTTGKAGGCNLREVVYGQYTIEATADGYENAVDSLTVDADELNVELSLDLTQTETIVAPTFEETENGEF